MSSLQTVVAVFYLWGVRFTALSPVAAEAGCRAIKLATFNYGRTTFVL
jgi:hypothetical protein